MKPNISLACGKSPCFLPGNSSRTVKPRRKLPPNPNPNPKANPNPNPNPNQKRNFLGCFK